MEIVQELIKKIVMIIPILLVLALFFWLADKFIPTGLFKNYFVNKDVLPPPANVEKFVAPLGEIPSNTVWTANLNDVSYHEPLLSYYNNQNLNPNYIRNVNIRKYGNVYSGMIIRGEVKRSFFALGTFPIFVEDMKQSRSFTQARAINPSQAGDWINFEAILGQITQKNQCNIVFKNANPAGDPHYDIYTTLPVNCI